MLCSYGLIGCLVCIVVGVLVFGCLLVNSVVIFVCFICVLFCVIVGLCISVLVWMYGYLFTLLVSFVVCG